MPLFKHWVHPCCLQYKIHSLAGSSLSSAKYTHGIVCLVKLEHDVFLTVLLSNFTDLESRWAVALLTVLLSFWCLFNSFFFATWCQDLLLAVSSCVAYKDVQLHLQCTLLISSPSLLLIFCRFSSLISLWLTLPLSEFKPSVLCQSFSHTSLCQRWFYCWGKFILHFPSRWYKLFAHEGQQFCFWGYLLA